MILVINAGSSSMKFQLYKINGADNYSVICKGLAERINVDGAFHIEYNDQKISREVALPDHSVAAKVLIETLKDMHIIKDFSDIKGVGHRVVHGGEMFTQSTVITKEVMSQIEKCSTLAPLHNPPAIAAIKAFEAIIDAPNVAVFDTSFHQTMPRENFLYSTPYEWYADYQVRRYGFHGISYRYINQKLADMLNKPVSQLNAIVCHLGNGASVCAIKNGKSFNTSMGLTPLEGLIMGTRSGDVDPSIHEYISEQTKLSLKEITNILNKKSGLFGISGVSPDARDIEAAAANGNDRAQLAVKMFAKRIAKYISWYQNELENKVDAIVFTAGIGENSKTFRKLISDEMFTLKMDVNDELNAKKYDDFNLISGPNADTKVFAIRTNEEIMICTDVYNLTQK